MAWEEYGRALIPLMESASGRRQAIWPSPLGDASCLLQRPSMRVPGIGTGTARVVSESGGGGDGDECQCLTIVNSARLALPQLAQAITGTSTSSIL